MIRRILNLDAYTLLPLGLVVFLLLTFTIPAYNHMNYNANIDYVLSVHNKFKNNSILFNETIFNNSVDNSYIEINGVILAPNEFGYPGGDGKGGVAENAMDCKNIWYAMTDNEVSADIGSIKSFKNVNSEFLIDYDLDNKNCNYYYIDKKEVKRNNKKGSHIIVYNTYDGKLKLKQNVNIF